MDNDLIVFAMIVGIATLFVIMLIASVIVPAEDEAKRVELRDVEITLL